MSKIRLQDMINIRRVKKESPAPVTPPLTSPSPLTSFEPVHEVEIVQTPESRPSLRQMLPIERPKEIEKPYKAPVVEEHKAYQAPSVDPHAPKFQDEAPSREDGAWYSPIENKFTATHNSNVVSSRISGIGKGGGSKYKLWILAFLCVIGLLFAASFFFAKAHIVVNPKVQSVTLNQTFSATKDSATDALPFSLIVISGEQDKTITNAVGKTSSSSATGKVFLYNNYSSTSQPIAINTQLQGSNGKIYKTKIKVTIPGKSKTGTAGKVEVAIYASAAGAEYNSGPMDFTFVGFKGTAKASKIYARSDGSIAGGQKGKYYQIPDPEKTPLKTELTNALTTQLLKKATDQIPTGFILYKDAIFLNTDSNNIDTVSSTSATSVTATLKGTLYGFLFDEKKLTKEIAKSVVDKYDGNAVHIPDIKSLVFKLSNSGSVAFGSVGSINFSLTGPAKIVWDVDPSKLTASLLGRSKKEFNQILSTYPNIDSANLTITPFWVFSLPSKEKNILIQVNQP